MSKNYIFVNLFLDKYFNLYIVIYTLSFTFVIYLYICSTVVIEILKISYKFIRYKY